MAEKFNHVAIFRARMLIGDKIKISIGSLKIESLTGPITFDIATNIARVHVIGVGEEFIRPAKLELPDNETFLLFQINSEESDTETLGYFNSEIDKAITRIAISYIPHLFFEEVYRGPLLGKKWLLNAGMRPSDRIKIKGKELRKNLNEMSIYTAKNNDLKDRFALMSRFYSKSLKYDPSEEKFMLMWTILEIYPMMNESDIRPLKEMLVDITGRKKEEIEEKIGIGRLYGRRCRLVHDGFLDLMEDEELFTKLEFIVHEIMRRMNGLKSSGLLEERYLDK